MSSLRPPALSLCYKLLFQGCVWPNFFVVCVFPKRRSRSMICQWISPKDASAAGNLGPTAAMEHTVPQLLSSAGRQGQSGPLLQPLGCKQALVVLTQLHQQPWADRELSLGRFLIFWQSPYKFESRGYKVPPFVWFITGFYYMGSWTWEGERQNAHWVH